MFKKTTMRNFLLTCLTVGLAMPVFAQDAQLEGSINISSIDDVLKIINNVAVWMYRIILALAVIFILIAAFTFLTAEGKTENVKKARQQIFYAVIALIVAILAFSASTIINNILGK